MKRVDKATEFDDALASAMREAQASFGDPRVLVEKYVLSPPPCGKSRFSPTSTAQTWCISTSATARFSAGHQKVI